MLVVDTRSEIGEIDQAALEDKRTADQNNVGYYVAASLNADDVRHGRTFKIGDGKIYGGYINYPLSASGGKSVNWQLVPISKLQSNNPLDAALSDDRAKVCGITENGHRPYFILYPSRCRCDQL